MRGRDVRRLAPSGPTLGPGHVGPESLSQPPPCRIRGRDERRREGEAPGRSLALEAAAAAPVTDEMPDLVQRHEVAHLPADGRDANLEASLARTVTVPDGDHNRPPTTVDARDLVRKTEVVDVTVEGGRLHGSSLDARWKVTVACLCSTDVVRVS